MILQFYILYRLLYTEFFTFNALIGCLFTMELSIYYNSRFYSIIFFISALKLVSLINIFVIQMISITYIAFSMHPMPV